MNLNKSLLRSTIVVAFVKRRPTRKTDNSVIVSPRRFVISALWSTGIEFLELAFRESEIKEGVRSVAKHTLMLICWSVSRNTRLIFVILSGIAFAVGDGRMRFSGGRSIYGSVFGDLVQIDVFVVL